MTPRAYQRRRRGPVLVVVALLAVAAAVTWTSVLTATGRTTGSAACSPPAAGTPAGRTVAADTLAPVAPLPPAAVKVTVLNAGGQRGQANLVAAQLHDLGFTQIAPPGNDQAYPAGDMTCVAQIRFGAAGKASASTVALVVPCAELRQDDRPGDGVDLAVGTVFGDLNPPRATKDVLKQLGDAGDDDPAAAPPSTPPTVDAPALAAARHCG